MWAPGSQTAAWSRPNPLPNPQLPQHAFGLDLARAIAIALVLIAHTAALFGLWFHAPPSPAITALAYYGIDLFYVLSGLLIGRILLGQIAAADLARTAPKRWLVFMQRRWLRTLPAYYAVLLILALFWAPIMWLKPPHTIAIAALFALMLQNLAWPMVQGNFFDASWSLAVEEWFYLLFATMLFALAPRLRPARAYALCLLPLLMLPLLARLSFIANGADHIVVFWLDSIALGALLAATEHHRPRLFAHLAFLLPLGLAGAAASEWFRLTHYIDPSRLRLSVEPLAAALSLALCLPALAQWRTAHPLLAAPIRLLARLSYALYLVHLSVLEFIDAAIKPWRLTPTHAALLATVIIPASALLLHHAIERPFMARRPREPL